MRIFAAAISVTLLSSLAFAQSLARAPIAESPTFFAPLNSVNVAAFPPPPTAGSTVDKNDFATLMTIQTSRTKAQCAAAEEQAMCDLPSFFGSLLSQKELAAVSDLYGEVFNDTDYFVNGVKARFNRPRPYLRFNSIHICIDPNPTTSYPSGHSAISRAMARTLGLIFPDRADAFLRLGNQAAMNRMIGGVHHPSDVRAGQAIGDLVFEGMTKNPKFVETISQIQKSLKN